MKSLHGRSGFILLCVAALSVVASACTTGREPAPAPIAAAPVTRERPPKVKFTRAELEEIRTAAIQYCQEKKPELWERFVQELQRGAIFLEEEQPRYRPPGIGLWKIEQNQEVEGIALVRWANDSIAFYFCLSLAKQDGKWTVTGDFTREEFFDPEVLEGIPEQK